MHTLQQLLSGELKGAKHVKLSCGLAEFPEELFSLTETLEVLDLSVNSLSRLPKDFGRFSKLRIAFFSDNLFTELPSVLGDCRQLSMIGFKSNQIEYVPENALPATTRWLILTNNRIKELPKSIGHCLPLQKVALAGNQLTTLPPETAACLNLELLRISANSFKELPEWLFQLPKLSWLAFSGNPFSHVPENINKLEAIDWNEFEILNLLGEGASGHIYKALWRKNNSVTEVAIKVFKGEVTSDGFPEDEMQASIAAGTHSHLVSLLGEIKNHPGQKQGLIMSLIPSSYSNLGMPPSLETCSRDTFKEGTIFSIQQILKIISGIASTAHHLHERGINHGDLYAHNILVDENANALMGDFGAASFYVTETPDAKKIEQVEIRAFGCLIEDLLIHIHSSDKQLERTLKLTDLKNDLMQKEIDKRPLFKEVISILKEI